MDVSIKWAQPPPWPGSISFLWLPESHCARSIVSRKQVMFQYYLPFRQIKRKSQRASGASRKEKRKPYSLNTNARRHVWQAVSLFFSLLCLHFPKWKVAVHDQHAPGNCCLTPKEMWHFLQIVGCQTWHSRNPSMISGGWWSCLWQRGWNLVILGVPSNPSHSMMPNWSELRPLLLGAAVCLKKNRPQPPSLLGEVTRPPYSCLWPASCHQHGWCCSEALCPH